jgi:diguanylate cyclase (GGDEF)-like protein
MELMLTDSLTGVANRRALNDQLEKEVKRAKRYKKQLGVIMTDLDFFKSINDSYGHTAGDEVLKAFAEVMRETVRATDFIARYGGEEFVLILPEISRDDLYEITCRIREAFESTDIPGLDKAVTASFGAAVLDSTDDHRSLLSRADKALYNSKELGRNCVTMAA